MRWRGPEKLQQKPPEQTSVEELVPGQSHAELHTKPCSCQGGKTCVRENPATQSGGNAIPGLHSSFVGQRILVMARPWQHYIIKFNVIEAFVRQGVAMVLNLQEAGEHGACGPGNLASSGLSYDPQLFLEAQIGFCHLGWPEAEVPELDRMVDIVQVMEHVTAVEKRKLAVHCHSGLGRSCLAIACFFVWSGEYNARSAVAAIRRLRPGALAASQQQVGYVSVFEKYLMHLRCLFKPAANSPLLLPEATSVSQLFGSETVPPTNTSSAAGAGALVKVDSTGIQSEIFPNGLTIVRAVKSGKRPGAQLQSADEPPVAAGGTLGMELPWNVHFHMHSQHQYPEPPHTYEEALARQLRLHYGPDRHSYQHLHAFVKTAAFAVIEAAVTHREMLVSGSLGRQQQQQWHEAQPHTVYLTPYNGAYSGGVGSAAPLPAPPASFAHAVCTFIGDKMQDDAGGAAGPATASLEAMAQAPGFKAFVGSAVSKDLLAAALAKVKQAANLHQYEPLSSAPVAVLLLAVQEFFGGLDSSVPSLSVRGLERMCELYTLLPFSQSRGMPVDTQVKSASAFIAPLPASDQELLLLFAAMMRQIARASGAGCEPEMVQICRWLAVLLLGDLASKPAVEEALCCYLWCLVRNDAAFAAAICCKCERILLREAAPAGPPAIPGLVPGAERLELHGARAPLLADWQIDAPQQQLQAQRHAQAQLQAKAWSEAAYRKLTSKAVPGLSWFVPGGFPNSHTAAPKPVYSADVENCGPPHPRPIGLGSDKVEQRRTTLQCGGLPPGIPHETLNPIQRIVHYVWL